MGEEVYRNENKVAQFSLNPATVSFNREQVRKKKDSRITILVTQ